MYLKRLQLKNYRRYKNADLEFPDGLIGIVGKNGSGKSSLIEAIGWCMYGSNASRTLNNQIMTTGISPSENCSVTLEMMLGSDSIRIVRELKGKNSTSHASLFVNGSDKVHVTGGGEVSEYIAKRTGMDSSAFFTSVFAKQKELDYLSTLKPAERKNIIMKLLRIDKINDAIVTIREDIKYAKTEISHIQSNIKDLDTLDEELERLSKDKNYKLIQKKEYKNKIDELSKQVEERKKELEKYEQKYRKHNEIQNTLDKIIERKDSKIESKTNLEGDLEIANESKEKMIQLEPKVEKYKILKKEKNVLDSLKVKFQEKKGLEENHKDLSSKTHDQKQENQIITSKLDKFNQFYKNLETSNKELSTKEAKKEKLYKYLSDISANIDNDYTQQSKLEEDFSKIKESGKTGHCPTCKLSLVDTFDSVSKLFSDKIDKLTKTIDKNQKEKKQLDPEYESLQSEIDSLELVIDGLLEEKEKKIRLETELNAGKKTLDTHNKEKIILEKKLVKFTNLKYNEDHHNTVIEQFEQLDGDHDDYIESSTKAKDIPRLLKREKQFISDILDLKQKEDEENKKLDSIEYEQSDHDDSKNNYNEASQNHVKLREQSIELDGDINTLNVEIKNLQQNIKETKDNQKKILQEQEKIAIRSKLDEIMNKFKLNLISRIRPVLSQRSSDLFRKMTNGKYSSIELDADYNIIIADEGEKFPIDRFSGGESDLANLCLRIAISQELSERVGGTDSNFIALDEVFGSQDEERKTNILDGFSALTDYFKQILIITHVEDVKEKLPYVLTIKELDDNTVKIQIEGNI